MVTKKTVSCACENCKCDPCECGKNGACCSPQRGFWWSVLRISLAVAIISGAYIAGVVCGSHRGEWMDDNMSGYRGYGRDTQMMRNHGPMNREKMSMSNMMNRYGSSMMNSSGMMMSMSMADMGKMLEGKTGDALDKAFLEGMIPHHQAAVDMAKYLAGSKHPELVKLGADIIAAQTKEIEQMKKWMVEWGYVSTGTTQTGTMMHRMPDGTMMEGGM